eukprot:1548284-Rhodomonas_salina.1
MQCPVLRQPMLLCSCYAVRYTDLAYAATQLRPDVPTRRTAKKSSCELLYSERLHRSEREEELERVRDKRWGRGEGNGRNGGCERRVGVAASRREGGGEGKRLRPAPDHAGVHRLSVDSKRRNQLQATVVSVQCVLGMCRLGFDFALQ